MKHTFVICSRWYATGTQAEIALGMHLSQDNMTEVMLEEDEDWKLIHEWAANIVKLKEREKTKRQARQRGKESANNQQNGR